MNVHYQRLNVDLIHRAIEQFLNIDEIVFLLNKTIKNIFSNYIPHETVTCDDRKIHHGLFPTLSSYFKRKTMHLEVMF